MEIKYTVVSCVEDSFDMTVEVNGSPMAVKAPGIVLELMSLDGSMGHTFRFAGANAAEVLAAYPLGHGVTVTVTPDE